MCRCRFALYNQKAQGDIRAYAEERFLMLHDIFHDHSRNLVYSYIKKKHAICLAGIHADCLQFISLEHLDSVLRFVHEISQPFVAAVGRLEGTKSGQRFKYGTYQLKLRLFAV